VAHYEAQIAPAENKQAKSATWPHWMALKREIEEKEDHAKKTTSENLASRTNLEKTGHPKKNGS